MAHCLESAQHALRHLSSTQQIQAPLTTVSSITAAFTTIGTIIQRAFSLTSNTQNGLTGETASLKTSTPIIYRFLKCLYDDDELNNEPRRCAVCQAKS